MRWYLHPDSVTWGVPGTGLFVWEHERIDDFFKISPNPSDGMIMVELAERSGMSLLIVDSSGKTIWQDEARWRSTLEVDLSGRLPGMYLLNLLENGVLTRTTKLVIGK